MVFAQVTENIGKAFIFDRIRPHLREYLLKAGYVEVPYTLFGALFWFSLLPVSFFFIFYVWDFILGLETNVFFEFILALLSWSIIHLAIIGVICLIIYFYLDLKIFNRTKNMEQVMPDFLRMVSENLKGGMPFEKALWGSIRPEFGVLAAEVRLSAKKVITGQDVEDALHEFTFKYDSPMIQRSFNLIIEGLKGGAKISEVIDQVIANIEQTRELKAEMAATNLSYVIFVAVIVLVVAPGLFTLSFQFLGVLQNISGKVDTESSAGIGLPINFGNVSVDPDTFKTFSMGAVAVIAFFASMMISMIQKGNIKAGVRYIPIMMVTSHLMYRLMMFAAEKTFAGFLV